MESAPVSNIIGNQPLRLLLIFVVYHSSSEEVKRLSACLDQLEPFVGYGLVINDYQPGEPAERLCKAAKFVVKDDKNLGYGRAMNLGVQRALELGIHPLWIGALNTDLSWKPQTFDTLLDWLEQHDDVVLAVPAITGERGETEKLCKLDPSILALLSRRFWLDCLKPRWLKAYDRRYVMAGCDLGDVLDVPYLSGCCMLIRLQAYEFVQGFDERFFLYLEDADLTRKLRAVGRCVHLPIASVQHQWGRGNHRSLKLTWVNLVSAWIYFQKWGWKLF